MPNTYTQLYVHLVFAVKNRDAVIAKNWKNNLYKYITGIVTNKSCKLYAIGGMYDHIHVFVSMSPNQSVSSLVADIKRSSSLWINENKFVVGKFSWQEGFGAFSYSKSQISQVVKYIENQENHHKKLLFVDEYRSLLSLFEIEYDEKYLFKQID